MKYLRWIISVVILCFGVITLEYSWRSWMILGLILHSIPLVLQLTRIKLFWYWAIWWGVALMVQTLISPIVFGVDYKTLKPNYKRILDVESGLPGINGRQIITTDDKGFRTTKNINYDADDTFRVFFMGGSTFEQIYLDDYKTTNHLLQEMLSEDNLENVEVINTGLSGLRAKNNLATFKKIVKYKPDVAVFLLGINDWNYQILQVLGDKNRISFLQKCSLRKTMLGEVISYFWYKYGKTSDNNTIKKETGQDLQHLRGSLNLGKRYNYFPVDVSNEFKDANKKISNICKDNDIVCIFLTQPTGYKDTAEKTFRDGFWMTPLRQDYTLSFESIVHIAELYNKFTAQFAEKNGHLSCDISSQIIPSYELFYDDCHFNEYGARVVAELIYECIEDIAQVR